MTSSELSRLRRMPPLERYREATKVVEEHRTAMGEAAKVRGEAIKELQKTGANMTELAKLLGISRQTLYQVMHGRE